jgi:hypothetical protein
MKTRILICLIFYSLWISIPAATRFWSSYQFSQDLGSANNYEHSVDIFCNFDTSMVNQKQIQYRDGTALITTNMRPHDIAYLSSLKARIFFNGSLEVKIGFKSIDRNGKVHLAPVKLSGTNPGFEELSPCITDSISDAEFPDSFLDLVSNRISYDSNRWYIGIENNGGGFPTSDGSYRYSYMGVISKPNDNNRNQTTYGLIYTENQAGVISPGLYKITGTGLSDLQRIGNITIQTFPGTNYLILSCLKSDLMADTDFHNWYAPSYCLGFSTKTQRLSLANEIFEVDHSPNSIIYSAYESYMPTINHIPTLSQPMPMSFYHLLGRPKIVLHVLYKDSNSDVPLMAKAIFDGAKEFDFITSEGAFNSASGVSFYTDEVTSSYMGQWSTLTYRFWYTLTEYVDTTVVNTGNQDAVSPAPQLTCNIYPNPFAKDVNIRIDNPKADKVDISIYNIRGQLVKRIYEGVLEKGTQNYQWNSSESTIADKASGMYFLRIKTEDKVITKKMVRIN